MENIICSGSLAEGKLVRGCSEPVKFCCSCAMPPVYLCDLHTDTHLAKQSSVQHQMSRISEQVPDTSLVSLITSERTRIDSHISVLTSSLSELQTSLNDLQMYIYQLSSKSNTLAQLKEELETSPGTVLISMKLREFFAHRGSDVRDGQGLLEYVGKFLVYDHKGAVAALQLRPETNQDQATLQNKTLEVPRMRLTLVQEIVSQTDTGVSKDSNMCFLDDSSLFICGGQSNKAYLIHPADGKSTLADMKKARRNHGIVHFRSFIYVFSGLDIKNNGLKNWERFSLETQSWDRLESMKPRCFFNPCVLDAKIYLAGGYSEGREIEEFHPDTGKFKSLNISYEAKEPPIRQGGIALVFNGVLVVLHRSGATHVDLAQRKGSTERISESYYEVQWQSLVAPISEGEGAMYILVMKGAETIKLQVSLGNRQQIAMETIT